jgi:hypothetical protein
MAAGDILACRFASAAEHNGFVAEIDIDSLGVGGTYAFGLTGNNDPASAKVVFTVTSPGYTAAGASTTITRTVYGTQWVRKAYPDEATANETDAGATLTVRVALSDFVYAGDTATVTVGAGFYTESATPTASITDLAVTNNSTLTHAKVIGRWAWPAFERVTDDFLLEAVCLHRHPGVQKPVACVVFEVTDGTATEYATVTDMTVSTRAGVGAAADNKVLVYAATIPIASFTQGAVLTCNFTAYPWVGDADAVLESASGITPPDERLTPLLLLCDKNETYGGGVCVVDSVNGQASTAATWVYANQAAAEAGYTSANTNSYNTIGRAAAAIKAYNNANLSRNEPGGGTILLTGTHDWPGTTNASTLGAQNTWLTITRHSGTARASAIVNGVSTSGINAQRIKFSDVTLFANGATEAIRGTSQTTDVNWIDQCALDLTGTTSSQLGTWLLGHATRNEITALSGGLQGTSANRAPYALVRGNVGLNASPGSVASLYAHLGNYGLRAVFQSVGNASGHAISDNAIGAFNAHYALGNATAWHNIGTDTEVTHGIAFVQNLVERLANDNWAMEVDGDGAASRNVLYWHNTMAGARMGMGYNDIGSVAYLHTLYSLRNNVLEEWANKDDTFGTPNAARTGAWPVGYNVGAVGNHRLENGGTTEYEGEFIGLHSVSDPLSTWAFVDNAAGDAGGGGDGTGNGDYHLDVSAEGYDLIPAGFAILPYDLEGTARTNAGGGSAGVFEMNEPAPPAARKLLILRA